MPVSRRNRRTPVFVVGGVLSLLQARTVLAQEQPPPPRSDPPNIFILPPAPLPPELAPVQPASRPVDVAPPPPPAPPTPPHHYTPDPRLAFRAEGGATFSRIYDIPITGGEGTIALGAEFKGQFAIYGGLSVFAGQQETGLSAVQVHFSGDIEKKWGRFRLGGGASVGDLSLERATVSTNTEALMLGLLALASFDVIQWGEHNNSAVYLSAKFRADLAFGDDAPVLWGPTFGLGVRIEP
jgi:hypothetical protein